MEYAACNMSKKPTGAAGVVGSAPDGNGSPASPVAVAVAVVIAFPASSDDDDGDDDAPRRMVSRSKK